jgi:site-specific DNA recombinase
MLADIGAGRIDAIIVYHGDRLIRQPWDLELLLKLADDRQLALAAPSGIRDLGDEEHRFILRIEAAQACKSSADTSRRVRRGWEARAKQGRPIGGGKRPFGFKDLETHDPVERALLAEAAERLLAGQSKGSVLRWLNERATGTEGKPFTTKSLDNLLKAPRIAGLVDHQGTLYEAVWRPVLGDQSLPEAEHREQAAEMWEDLKLLLRQNGESHPYPGRERRYLLSGAGGAGRCSACDGPLHTKPAGGRNRKTARIYFCKGCRKFGRNVVHLDAYVEARVLRRLNEPGFLEEVYTEEHAAGGGRSELGEIVTLERRKAETEEQLRKLADHPNLSADLLVTSLESFDRRISEIRTRRAATARQRLLAKMAGITRERWDATPIDVRAATVAALFRVVLLPATWRGPGFDPESVRLDPVKARPGRGPTPCIGC